MAEKSKGLDSETEAPDLGFTVSEADEFSSQSSFPAVELSVGAGSEAAAAHKIRERGVFAGFEYSSGGAEALPFEDPNSSMNGGGTGGEESGAFAEPSFLAAGDQALQGRCSDEAGGDASGEKREVELEGNRSEKGMEDVAGDFVQGVGRSNGNAGGAESLHASAVFVGDYGAEEDLEQGRGLNAVEDAVEVDFASSDLRSPLEGEQEAEEVFGNIVWVEEERDGDRGMEPVESVERQPFLAIEDDCLYGTEDEDGEGNLVWVEEESKGDRGRVLEPVESVEQQPFSAIEEDCPYGTGDDENREENDFIVGFEVQRAEGSCSLNPGLEAPRLEPDERGGEALEEGPEKFDLESVRAEDVGQRGVFNFPCPVDKDGVPDSLEQAPAGVENGEARSFLVNWQDGGAEGKGTVNMVCEAPGVGSEGRGIKGMEARCGESKKNAERNESVNPSFPSVGEQAGDDLRHDDPAGKKNTEGSDFCVGLQVREQTEGVLASQGENGINGICLHSNAIGFVEVNHTGFLQEHVEQEGALKEVEFELVEAKDPAVAAECGLADIDRVGFQNISGVDEDRCQRPDTSAMRLHPAAFYVAKIRDLCPTDKGAGGGPIDAMADVNKSQGEDSIGLISQVQPYDALDKPTAEALSAFEESGQGTCLDTLAPPDEVEPMEQIQCGPQAGYTQKVSQEPFSMEVTEVAELGTSQKPVTGLVTTPQPRDEISATVEGQGTSEALLQMMEMNCGRRSSEQLGFQKFSPKEHQFSVGDLIKVQGLPQADKGSGAGPIDAMADVNKSQSDGSVGLISQVQPYDALDKPMAETLCASEEAGQGTSVDMLAPPDKLDPMEQIQCGPQAGYTQKASQEPSSMEVTEVVEFGFAQKPVTGLVTTAQPRDEISDTVEDQGTSEASLQMIEMNCGSSEQLGFQKCSPKEHQFSVGDLVKVQGLHPTDKGSGGGPIDAMADVNISQSDGSVGLISQVQPDDALDRPMTEALPASEGGQGTFVADEVEPMEQIQCSPQAGYIPKASQEPSSTEVTEVAELGFTQKPVTGLVTTARARDEFSATVEDQGTSEASLQIIEMNFGRRSCEQLGFQKCSPKEHRFSDGGLIKVQGLHPTDKGSGGGPIDAMADVNKSQSDGSIGLISQVQPFDAYDKPMAEALCTSEEAGRETCLDTLVPPDEVEPIEQIQCGLQAGYTQKASQEPSSTEVTEVAELGSAQKLITGLVTTPQPRDEISATVERQGTSEASSQMIKTNRGRRSSEHLGFQKCSPKEYQFSVGDLVWGKVRSHPWWPGQIFDASDSSEIAKKHFKKNYSLVAYFGDATFGWSKGDESRLIPFQENFEEKSKQTPVKGFCSAVMDALDELARRVELGLTCFCQYGEVRSRLERKAMINAGICDGAIVNDHKDISSAVNAFHPSEFLSTIKSWARSPLTGHTLDVTVARAQVSAILTFKGLLLSGKISADSLGKQTASEEIAGSTGPSPILEGSINPDLVSLSTFMKSCSSSSGKHRRKSEGMLSRSPKKRRIGDLIAGDEISYKADEGMDGHDETLLEIAGSKAKFLRKLLKVRQKSSRMESALNKRNSETANTIGHAVENVQNDDVIKAWEGKGPLPGKATPLDTAKTREGECFLRELAPVKNNRHQKIETVSASDAVVNDLRIVLKNRCLASLPAGGEQDAKKTPKSSKFGECIMKVASELTSSPLGTRCRDEIAGSSQRKMILPKTAEPKEEERCLRRKVTPARATNCQKLDAILASDATINDSRPIQAKRDLVSSCSGDDQHAKKTPKSFKFGECILKVASELTSTPPGAKGMDVEAGHKTQEGERKLVVNADKNIFSSPSSKPKAMWPFRESCSTRELLEEVLIVAQQPLHWVGEKKTPFRLINSFLEFRNAVFQKSPGYGSYDSDVTKASAFKFLSQSHKLKSPKNSSKMAGFANPENSEESDRIDKVSFPRSKGHCVQEKLKRKVELPVEGARKKSRHLIRLPSPPWSTKSSKQKQEQKVRDQCAKHYSRRTILPQLPVKSSRGLPDDSNSNQNPASLFMRFPKGFALPSETELKAKFTRFGPLEISETKVFRRSGCAQVVFKRCSDAQVAFNFVSENNLFGSASVSFRLRRFSSATQANTIQKTDREIYEKSIPQDFRQTRQPPLLKDTLRDVKGHQENMVQSCGSIVPSVEKVGPSRPNTLREPPLRFIQQNLEMMTSMLSRSGERASTSTMPKSDNVAPDNKADIMDEMMCLLQKVSALVGSSPS